MTGGSEFPKWSEQLSISLRRTNSASLSLSLHTFVRIAISPHFYRRAYGEISCHTGRPWPTWEGGRGPVASSIPSCTYIFETLSVLESRLAGEEVAVVVYGQSTGGRFTPKRTWRGVKGSTKSIFRRGRIQPITRNGHDPFGKQKDPTSTVNRRRRNGHK